MQDQTSTTESGTQASNAAGERSLLKKIGNRIQRDLAERKQTVEWLSSEIGIARSTLREVIAGRSNPRILTVHAIAVGLGYGDAQAFLAKVFADPAAN